MTMLPSANDYNSKSKLKFVSKCKMTCKLNSTFEQPLKLFCLKLPLKFEVTYGL